MRSILIACLFIALAAPARAGDPVAAIPYDINSEGWIVVNATVDGKGPYEFVIDTGATISFVFENMAAKYDFEPTGREPVRILGITTEGRLDTYFLGDIRVGAATLEDHVGVILEDWPAPRRTPHGVIGLDFLQRYAVHFDARQRLLTLYEHGDLPKALTDDLAKVDLVPKTFGNVGGALFTAEGDINRSRMTFIIDLGSASTLINYKAAEMLIKGVVIRDSASPITGTRLQDVFGDRSIARITRINRFRLDGVTWRGVESWVFNAPLFDEIGVQDRPYGFAGVDLFKDRDFALDFGENVLYVSRRAVRR